ncbi:MAG TPA: hypothetical protein VGR45_11080 [Stellaceae bacterium]|nr:hypothetical protein [Stellaceae bacterium]
MPVAAVAAAAAGRVAFLLAEMLAQLGAQRAATRRYAEQFDWQPTTNGQIALFHEICAPAAE